MKKNSIRGYIVLAICFVVFSVIAFAAPFNKANAVFWMAYVFAVIAMASQIYIFRVSFSGENVKSKFYGFPIARIGVIYLITQVVLSLFEMILGGIIPAWVVIILNIIIAAVAAIGCITTEGIKEEIERQDVVLKAKVSAMRELQSLSAALVEQASGDVQHVVEELADEFRYSDPVSCDEAVSCENELKNLLIELQKALIDGDSSSANMLCGKTKNTLAERNRICKLNK